jgi:hypothetical protein
MRRFQSYAPVHLERLDTDPVLLERVPPDGWRSLLADPDGASEYHLQELLAKAPGVLSVEEFSSVFAPAVCIGREVSTSKGPIDNLFMSMQGRLTIAGKLWPRLSTTYLMWAVGTTCAPTRS